MEKNDLLERIASGVLNVPNHIDQKDQQVAIERISAGVTTLQNALHKTLVHLSNINVVQAEMYANKKRADKEAVMEGKQKSSAKKVDVSLDSLSEVIDNLVADRKGSVSIMGALLPVIGVAAAAAYSYFSEDEKPDYSSQVVSASEVNQNQKEVQIPKAPVAIQRQDTPTSDKFAQYLRDTIRASGSGALMGASLGSSADYDPAGQGFGSQEAKGSSENAQKAMDFFMSKGWSKEQAAGIVGNLQNESGKDLNPSAIARNDAGPGLHSYGIAQWNRNRYAGLSEMAKRQNKQWNDLQLQLEYVHWELNNSEKGAGNALRKAKTPGEAAIAMSKYERFRGYELGTGSPEVRSRMANAAALAGSYGQTPVSTGSGSASMVDAFGYVRNKESGGFASPTRSRRVTSAFGMRTTGRGTRMHEGVDFGATTRGKDGDPIFATAAGVVRFAGRKGAYGNLIILDHGGGLESRYGHLSVIGVRVGDKVEKGQIIGRMGNTGRSSGTHLHFEIRRSGRAIDPTQLIGQGNSSPDAEATEPGNESVSKTKGRSLSSSTSEVKTKLDKAKKAKSVAPKKFNAPSLIVSGDNKKGQQPKATTSPKVDYTKYFGG